MIGWMDSARSGLRGIATWARNRCVIIVSELVIVDLFSWSVIVG